MGGSSESVCLARAIDAVIWGIPAVNTYRMLEAAETASGTSGNVMLAWSQPCDWRSQFLTPNTDALYLMPFVDTRQGPVVLEVPPAGDGRIVGSIMDCWQIALEDVGPAGADGGQGGRYVILPPGFDGETPPDAIVLESDVFTGYALLRSIPSSNSPEDIAAAVDYGRRVRLYALSAVDDPPEKLFTDVTEKVVDGTIPYDLEFFRILDRVVQTEPWLARDSAMIDPVAMLGILKGQPFGSDDEVLVAGAEAAHEWFSEQYESFAPFSDAGRWFLPVDPHLHEANVTGWNNTGMYPRDARGVIYHWGYSSQRRVKDSRNQLYCSPPTTQMGNLSEVSTPTG